MQDILTLWWQNNDKKELQYGYQGRNLPHGCKTSDDFCPSATLVSSFFLHSPFMFLRFSLPAPSILVDKTWQFGWAHLHWKVNAKVSTNSSEVWNHHFFLVSHTLQHFLHLVFRYSSSHNHGSVETGWYLQDDLRLDVTSYWEKVAFREAMLRLP